VAVSVYTLGEFNVCPGGDSGQEVETLKDVTDLLAPHGRTFRIRKIGDVDPVDQDVTACRLGETSQQVKKG
jgi:hypothetical protein